VASPNRKFGRESNFVVVCTCEYRIPFFGESGFEYIVTFDTTTRRYDYFLGQSTIEIEIEIYSQRSVSQLCCPTWRKFHRSRMFQIQVDTSTTYTIQEIQYGTRSSFPRRNESAQHSLSNKVANHLSKIAY
jgi:hypothetical protein